MEIRSLYENLSTGKKLLLITILGFLARLYVVLRAVTVAEDSLAYLNLAKRFAHGNLLGGLSIYRPPLYPFLVGMASYIFGDIEISGRAVSLIFGALTIPLVFYLGKLVYDERCGLFAAFFAALHFYMIRYSGDVLTEGMYYFFVALIAISALKAIRGKNAGWMFLCGLFSLFAYFTKPAGIGFLIVTSLWVAFSSPRSLKGDYKERIVLLISGWAIFIIPTLPYLAFIYAKTAVMPLTGTTRVSLVELSRGMARAFVGEENIVDFIRYFPAGFMYPFFAFFVVWAARKVREGTNSAERFLLSILIAYWLIILWVLPVRRYLVQLMPIALVFSSAGFLYFRVWADERIKKKGPLVAGIILFLVAAINLGMVSEPLHAHRLPEKLAGRWLKENIGRGLTVLTYDPILTFYADGEYVLIPEKRWLDLRKVVGYGKRKGAQYLAGYSTTLKKRIAGFDGEKEKLLMEIKSFEAEDKGEFVIYRINRGDSP